MKQTETCNNIVSYFIVIVVAAAAAYKTNATTSSSTQEDDKEFLDAHNKARLQAGMPPFTYDQTLANYARKHALSRVRDCALRHSKGPYGENLFWGSAKKSLKWTPKDAVTAWMNEEKYYNKKTLTCTGVEKCGHYTQIMWRDTKKVGCARSNCNGKSSYMVCEYHPAGNYEGLSPFVNHDPFIYTTQT